MSGYGGVSSGGGGASLTAEEQTALTELVNDVPIPHAFTQVWAGNSQTPPRLTTGTGLYLVETASETYSIWWQSGISSHGTGMVNGWSAGFWANLVTISQTGDVTGTQQSVNSATDYPATLTRISKLD